MSDAQALKQEIEAAASEFDLDPSTVGRYAGQGGKFYDRLSRGARCWPETAEKVRAWIADERARRSEAVKGAA